MRKSCIDCVIKHITQAHILMLESKLGYPLHYYIAIGHLAEAEDEVADISLAMANRIRDIRKDIEQKENADFDVLELIQVVLDITPDADDGDVLPEPHDIQQWMRQRGIPATHGIVTPVGKDDESNSRKTQKK